MHEIDLLEILFTARVPFQQPAKLNLILLLCPFSIFPTFSFIPKGCLLEGLRKPIRNHVVSYCFIRNPQEYLPRGFLEGTCLPQRNITSRENVGYNEGDDLRLEVYPLPFRVYHICFAFREDQPWPSQLDITVSEISVKFPTFTGIQQFNNINP